LEEAQEALVEITSWRREEKEKDKDAWPTVARKQASNQEVLAILHELPKTWKAASQSPADGSG
jgi:hypothetical protein